MEQFVSPCTKRAYQADWKDFTAWCLTEKQQPFPAHPLVVLAYLQGLVGERKTTTVLRRIAALNALHRSAGHPIPGKDPRVKHFLKSLKKRSHGPTHHEPILLETLIEILETLPQTVTGIRDRAVVLMTFAGGLARREVSELQCDDVSFVDEGIVVSIQVKKGASRVIGIPFGKELLTCPVRTLQDWLQLLASAKGSLFRAVRKDGAVLAHGISDQSVRLIVKRALALVGREESEFTAHSLRAGLLVQATIGGAGVEALQKQTGIQTPHALDRQSGTLASPTLKQQEKKPNCGCTSRGKRHSRQ